MRASFLFFGLIFFVSCKEKFDKKSYSQNKQSLSYKEQTDPQEFLKISAYDKKNLFGATVVKGKIINTASVCSYRNTRVKMVCFANGIRQEEHEDVINSIIEPGNERNFKTKYHLPKNTDSVSLTVMSAEPLLVDTLR